MPMAVWLAGMDKIEAAARAVDMPLRLDNAKRVAHIPTAETEAARSSLILEEEGRRDHTLIQRPVVPRMGSSSKVVVQVSWR